MVSAGSVALVGSPGFTGTAAAASGTDFQVSIDATNSPVTENESLTVTVNVTNNGSASGTQTITLTDPRNNQRDSVPVTLAAGASNDSVTLTWDTQVGVTGTGEVTVESDNDTATRTVTVYDRDDWPTVGYDRARTGHNPHTTGPTIGAIEQWNFSTVGAVRSSPAVVDGTVYVGSDDGNVYALNATNGAMRWRVSTGGRIRASPSVVDRTVYVGSNDTNVYALNATDGAVRWSMPTGGAVRSSPTVVDDTVYVGSNDNKVYALNATSGAMRWSVSTGGAIRASPAVVNDTVYVGSYDNKVYALNATDGAERWNATADGAIRSAPTVVDDTVYAGSTQLGGSREQSDSQIHALNATDGSERWNVSIGTSVGSSPAVAGDTLYASAYNDNLYALNATDGSERWNATTNGTLVSSPAVVNDTVYVGSYDTTVYALNATDGTERWNVRTNDNVYSSPAVADGTVYVGSDDGNVYALTEPGVIRGTVTNGTGSPVQTTVQFEYTGSRHRHVGSTTTDANGNYTFRVPDASRDYEVLIDDSNYTFASKSPISVTNGETTTVNIQLSEGGLINGTVTDANGTTVEGVRVEAYNHSSRAFVRGTQTDASGNYSLRVEADRYDVVVNDNDYELAVESNISVSTSQTTTADLQTQELPGTGYINGTVEDSNGNPIGTATVQAADSSFTNFAGDTTDPSGNFSMEVREGTYTVRAGANDYPPQVTQDINVTENQTTEITVTLQEPAYLNGTVTNASGGYPDNAFVIAETDNGVVPGLINNKTGEYNITVPPGDYQLTVFAENGTASSKSVTVAGGEVNTTNFELRETKIVHQSVEVVNGSTPAALGMRAGVRAGFLQAQVVNENTFPSSKLGPPSELEPLGLTSDTTIRMNITVTNFTANSLLWGLDDARWETSPNRTVQNGTDITIHGSPTTMQVNFDRKEVGPLITKDPSEVQWPTGTNDRATAGRNQTVYVGLFDLSTTPEEVRTSLKGMSVTTNAQTFSVPSVRNDSLRVWVAAPTLTTEGEDHTGFYQAEIPQSQLEKWNVTDPESELEALYKGSSADFTVTNTTDGARIRIDNITYSAGYVEIQADSDSGDESTDSTGSTGGGSTTDGDSDSDDSDGDDTSSSSGSAGGSGVSDTTTETPTEPQTETPSDSTTPTESDPEPSTPTETTPAEQTDETTETAADAPTETDAITETEQPGFGVVVAVIALLAASLSAVRRRE